MALSQKEYLKKYLSGGADKKEKRKKKRKIAAIATRTKIIDDDVDVSKMQPLDESALDLFELDEDAPQIAGIVDERPEEVQARELYRKSNRWKVLGNSEGDGLEVSALPSIERDDIEELDPMSTLVTGNSFNDNDRWGKRAVDDVSFARQKETGSSSSARMNRRSDDQSPPRRKKRTSDESPPRRKNRQDNDPSPLRKHRAPDSDESPPRRKNRQAKDPSPLRKHRAPDSDESPPRRKNRQAKDASPPRKERVPDSDESPPRRKNRQAKDASPPRKHRAPGSDESPPRRRKRSESPKRRRDLKENTPVRLISPSRIKVEKEPTKSNKMEKTLDGKVAGLQDAKKLKEELMEVRKKEEELFAQMDDSISGRGAAVVQRDRKTGLKRDVKQELKEQREKEQKQKKHQEKYDKWGKGLKQVEAAQERLSNDLHEMAKPLARYADDQDLDSHLRQQDREGDPMLDYIRKKRKEDSSSGQVKPKYDGPFPPNRYNIRPGYRWDGVDRSSGYEKQWFENINARKALEEEAYKWSTDDM